MVTTRLRLISLTFSNEKNNVIRQQPTSILKSAIPEIPDSCQSSFHKLGNMFDWKQRNIFARRLIRATWSNEPQSLPKFARFCALHDVELSLHNQQLLQFRLRQIKHNPDEFLVPHAQLGGGKVSEDIRNFLLQTISKY